MFIIDQKVNMHSLKMSAYLHFLIPGVTIKKKKYRPLIFGMEMATESLHLFHSFISFNRYWSYVCYLPGTVQDAWDTWVNKTGISPALEALAS